MWESIINAIAGLFGGGGGDAAAVPAAEAVSAGGMAPDAFSAAQAGGSFYPGSAFGAGDLLGAGALGLQGAGLASQFAQGGGQQQALPMSMMFGSAQQPGVDPSTVRARLSQQQSAGLSGASPDFLANQLGLTPDELQQILGQGGAGATVGRGNP